MYAGKCLSTCKGVDGDIGVVGVMDGGFGDIGRLREGGIPGSNLLS